jgi:hypothetical protein
MKQLGLFALKAVTFVACFCGIYLLVLFALTHVKVGGNKLIYRAVQGLVWKGGYSYDRFRSFDRDKKYDVLVFGSSRANRGLHPLQFEKSGYSLYNLGTDDQTPINTEVLVKDFVKKDKCRLVIIDMYDKVFAQNPLESTSDLIQNLNDDKTALKMAMCSGDMRAINQFGLRLMMKNSAPEYKAETKLYNGYRALNDNFHYSDDRHFYKRTERHMKAFEETLKYLQSIKVPCLLICQPLPLMPANHHQFVKDIEPLLEKYNQKLYDFTSMNEMVNPGGFADMSHLNDKGAERYSDFLIDSLVNDVLRDDGVASN